MLYTMFVTNWGYPAMMGSQYDFFHETLNVNHGIFMSVLFFLQFMSILVGVVIMCKAI